MAGGDGWGVREVVNEVIQSDGGAEEVGRTETHMLYESERERQRKGRDRRGQLGSKEENSIKEKLKKFSKAINGEQKKVSLVGSNCVRLYVKLLCSLVAAATVFLCVFCLRPSHPRLRRRLLLLE